MVGFQSQGQLEVPLRKTELGLRELVFILFRRRWVVLAIALPIILVGGINLLGRTGSYTAASRVLVELSNVDQPRWNIGGRNIDYDREMSTFINIGLSVAVADLASETLVDSLPVIRDLDPNLVTLEHGADFRDFLVGGLDINVVGESNILEFRHTTANPRIALMATGALRDAFIEYQNLGRRNLGAVDYYAEQVAIVRASIDSLLSERGEILGASGYTSLEDELRHSVDMATDSVIKLRKVKVDRSQLEVEYSLLRSFLGRDPREFPMGLEENRALTLVGWRDKVAKHENTLAEILTVHTEESIPARQQRELLEFAVERLRAEEVAYVESIRLKLESIRQRELILKQQVDETSVANRKLPAVYREVSMLDVDINALRALLKDLQSKWGEVRMNAMADDRVSQVTALTDPELVMVLGSSKSLVYLIMIVFLSLALGIVGAFVQETLDHRIYIPTDIEENLRLPVFVSITKVD